MSLLKISYWKLIFVLIFFISFLGVLLLQSVQSILVLWGGDIVARTQHFELSYRTACDYFIYDWQQKHGYITNDMIEQLHNEDYIVHDAPIMMRRLLSALANEEFLYDLGIDLRDHETVKTIIAVLPDGIRQYISVPESFCLHSANVVLLQRLRLAEELTNKIFIQQVCNLLGISSQKTPNVQKSFSVFYAEQDVIDITDVILGGKQDEIDSALLLQYDYGESAEQEMSTFCGQELKLTWDDLSSYHDELIRRNKDGGDVTQAIMVEIIIDAEVSPDVKKQICAIKTWGELSQFAKKHDKQIKIIKKDLPLIINNGKWMINDSRRVDVCGWYNALVEQSVNLSLGKWSDIVETSHGPRHSFCFIYVQKIIPFTKLKPQDYRYEIRKYWYYKNVAAVLLETCNALQDNEESFVLPHKIHRYQISLNMDDTYMAKLWVVPLLTLGIKRASGVLSVGGYPAIMWCEREKIVDSAVDQKQAVTNGGVIANTIHDVMCDTRVKEDLNDLLCQCYVTALLNAQDVYAKILQGIEETLVIVWGIPVKWFFKR